MDVPEYFYTLDLGKVYGPKLTRLASLEGHDDVEAFAAGLLCGAIDVLEKAWQDDLARAEAQGAITGDVASGKLDDDLPF